MTVAHNPALIAVELLASSVWVGSLVCLTVVASSARASLGPHERVEFFRALGRRHGAVGAGALIVAIGAGLAMSWPPSSWGDGEKAIAVLAAALVIVTAAGMRQARAITILRLRALSDATNGDLTERVHRGATLAAVLRGLIAAITLGLVGLAADVIAK